MKFLLSCLFSRYACNKFSFPLNLQFLLKMPRRYEAASCNIHPTMTNERSHFFPVHCFKIINCFLFACLISLRRELQLPSAPLQLDNRHNDTREWGKVLETVSSLSWSGRVPANFICIIRGLHACIKQTETLLPETATHEPFSLYIWGPISTKTLLMKVTD